MSDKVEKWGDSIDAAVELALKDMNLTRDEVNVEVLEQPSRGFFGIHKKLAKVRVTKKPEPAPIPEEKHTEESISGSAGKTENRFKHERREPENESKANVFGNSTYVVSDSHNNAFDYEKNSDESISSGKTGEKNHQRRQDRRDREYGRRPERKNQSRSWEKDAEIMHTKFTVTPEDTDAVPADDSYAVDFVRKIIKQMEINAEVHGAMIDDVLYINLSGSEVGTLIGKRGQTLDSVQYLASIVENKNSDKHIRVLVNAEHYREKREKTLQQLAHKIADKAVKSGRSQRLEPMNPYERKVIHSTLQPDPRVVTRSEGVEPSRRVVIELKK
ncbi:MAG: RNA-binding cell elongation regulator Jag/EloR [Anaerovoracaceae bacterium]|jgi:spoIIIJ-associated protein